MSAAAQGSGRNNAAAHGFASNGGGGGAGPGNPGNTGGGGGRPPREPEEEVGGGFTEVGLWEFVSTGNGGDLNTTWLQYTLNTETYNGITGASLAADAVTLPAGTYEVMFFINGGGAADFGGRLWNETDGVLVEYTPNLWCEPSTTLANVFGCARFTIAEPKAFSLYGSNQVLQSSNGRGSSYATSESANTTLASMFVRKIDVDGLTPELYAEYRHEVGNGGNGGSTSATTWNIRTLNVEVHDEIGITLSSNQLTMPAGTYFIELAQAGFSLNGQSFGRLWNDTDSAELLRGPTCFDASEGQQNIVRGEFTLDAEKDIEVQLWSTAAESTNGMGDTHSGHSGIETFCWIRIWKRA